ncbi:M15 family metallopeptidase [Cyclobacterium plantarum]|uniref:M15 family peptidase n=1 Tax=Cyclobacterium plantarum TaxID=2716263 RepID=A0ABX0H6K8_9BACT|nr:M15 family metallopeptidase [Cyclobacterium plantarum]NHE57495.1 M15 family peptidase [Cyclobacterium plantarum]
MKEKIKLAQQLLAEKGHYQGGIDGIFGPNTLGAIHKVPGIDHGLPNSRKITMLIQMGAKEKGFDAGAIDGMWGPQTQFGFEELAFLMEHGRKRGSWRPEEMPAANRWPRQNSPEFHEFYGQRGQNLVSIDVPYELKIAWDLRYRARKITCHRKVAESLLTVLENVLQVYGENDIQALHLNHFGGCYNNRLMRGGTQWSTHSWGMAVDFDPDRNRLTWGRDKAAFAHPRYDEWWRCWEEEGWVSLGRRRNFDWMHIQAAEV